MNPPRLVIISALERRPIVEIDAETAEDEQRLLLWLAAPTSRRRLAAVEDALDRLAEGSAT